MSRFPKLTPLGRLALLTALLIWLTAVNFQSNLAFLTADLLLALLIVSALWTSWQLRGTTVTPLPPTDGFAGSPVELFIVIQNRTPFQRVVQLHHLRAKEPKRVRLGPLEQKSVVLLLHFPKRGHFRLEPPRLSSTFPLGLWQVEREMALSASLWIYPRPARPLPPFPAGGLSGEEGGGELRSYRPGDPLSRIDWKHYSRERKLYVKFAPKERLPQACEIILRFSETKGDVERRLAVLCGWLLEAEKRGLVYRLQLPGQQTDPGRGQAHLKRCLRQLARYR